MKCPYLHHLYCVVIVLLVILGRRDNFIKKEGRNYKEQRPEYQKESIEMGKNPFPSFLQLYIWTNTGNSTVASFPCGGTKDVYQDIVLRHNSF